LRAIEIHERGDDRDCDGSADAADDRDPQPASLQRRLISAARRAQIAGDRRRAGWTESRRRGKRCTAFDAIHWFTAVN